VRRGHQVPAGCLLSLPGAVTLPGGLLHALRRRRSCEELQVQPPRRGVDLCACRTLATFLEEGDTRIATLDPVDIEFTNFTIRVQSVFAFSEGTGEIEIVRRIIGTTDPEAEVTIDEYITACYGTTEYPEDLSGVRLTLHGASGTETIEYAYQCREAEVSGITLAEALVPQVDTRLTMHTDTDGASGYYREGFAFSPMYTIGMKKTVKGEGELRTWLKVEKAS
jgi:hypothetical protein